MKRKIVQTGSSLAVTLPAEVVEAFGLKKGQEVEVTVHPATGAVVIRPGAKYFEDGKVTRRFRTLADSVLDRYDKAFEELAK
ncbi:MAG: AbrB/MazE/SpoVT family DNA-binding domain-containing protein [Vicinamibacterales bacterium]|jgi:antitoxin component of MazEF toxin-antitoxin module|nr:AbrB/MazE/SpoVT family DNA-binding domain-containing protein [Vicinamibacterales bacterium]